jgi:4-hydroxybenzoate polyprenyltransferase
VGASRALPAPGRRPPGAPPARPPPAPARAPPLDSLYALQDEDFDRAEGLHSVPAAFGARGAILISRALHTATVVLFILCGFLFPGAGAIYFVGVAVIALMLVYEQSLVKPGDLSRMDAAFFNTNAMISIVFFLFVVTERLLA